MNSRAMIEITPSDIRVQMGKMTVAEIEEAVGQQMLFREATDMSITEAMKGISELNNNEVGTSNKVICGRLNINHWSAIQYMRDIGWLDDDNNLTVHGFREMNDAVGVVSVTIDVDTLVLQNYNGALYWNRYHDEYERCIDQVVKGVKTGGYNDGLKATLPPISPQTRKMLLTIPTMTVKRADGTEIHR